MTALRMNDSHALLFPALDCVTNRRKHFISASTDEKDLHQAPRTTPLEVAISTISCRGHIAAERCNRDSVLADHNGSKRSIHLVADRV